MICNIHPTSFSMEASRWIGLSAVINCLLITVLGPAVGFSGAYWILRMIKRQVSLWKTQDIAILVKWYAFLSTSIFMLNRALHTSFQFSHRHCLPHWQYRLWVHSQPHKAIKKYNTRCKSEQAVYCMCVSVTVPCRHHLMLVEGIQSTEDELESEENGRLKSLTCSFVVRDCIWVNLLIYVKSEGVSLVPSFHQKRCLHRCVRWPVCWRWVHLNALYPDVFPKWNSHHI